MEKHYYMFVAVVLFGVFVPAQGAVNWAPGGLFVSDHAITIRKDFGNVLQLCFSIVPFILVLVLAIRIKLLPAEVTATSVAKQYVRQITCYLGFFILLNAPLMVTST